MFCAMHRAIFPFPLKSAESNAQLHGCFGPVTFFFFEILSFETKEETKDATPLEQPTAEQEAKETNETKEGSQGKEEQEGQGDTIEAVASSPASPFKPEAASTDMAQPRDELPNECVSRVERTHEETRQKERDEKNQRSQKSREAEKSGRWSKHYKWKDSRQIHWKRSKSIKRRWRSLQYD